jgi:hypothetical protein
MHYSNNQLPLIAMMMAPILRTRDRSGINQ